MIHHVFANRSNSGDWLSALGIQELLRPLPIQEHLCDEPFVDDTLRALGKLGEDDLVVIGGGGLLMDYFRRFWEGFADLAPGLRYCIWGIGVVDLKVESSVIDMELIRPIARSAELCVVRDDLTWQYLDIADIHASVPCPSLVSVASQPITELGLLHVVNLTTVGESAYEAMIRAGRTFASQVGCIYRETNNRFEDGAAGLTRNLELYRRSHVILSSRLHGCIIGLAMGRPVVAVSGDRKVEAFMQSVGLRDWVVDHTETGGITRLLHEAAHQPSARAWLSESIDRNIEVAGLVRQMESGRAPS